MSESKFTQAELDKARKRLKNLREALLNMAQERELVTEDDMKEFFHRWWAVEVHPTVRPSIHAEATHLAFGAALLKMVREALDESCSL